VAVSVLVVDVGTTGLRAAVVGVEGEVSHLRYRRLPPTSPAPGLVEFDAAELAAAVLDVVNEVLAVTSQVAAVGVTAQRASTIAFDGASGRPLAAGLGWQDLRTVGECIGLRATHGLEFAPNQTATKAAWLLVNAVGSDTSDVRIATVDAWLVYVLSGGRTFVTDHTNAAVTGLYDPASRGWSAAVCATLGIDPATLPTIVPSLGVLGEASALPGAPPIAGLIGDQQASLVGQGCTRAGQAKVTLGSGGMLDVVTGRASPTALRRGTHGTFPIVAWSDDATITYGSEAIMLAAGTNVEWLVDDLGLVESPEASDALAASVPDAAGVVFVPAPLGLGTPHWDYGARGTLSGLTRGTTRAHVVRAVLEGVAERVVDLVEAAEADTGVVIDTIAVDGGMSRNATLTDALARRSGRRVAVSAITEATTLGAAFVAGTAVGMWPNLAEAASHRAETTVIEPSGVPDRTEWHAAVAAAHRWIPELSALNF